MQESRNADASEFSREPLPREVTALAASVAERYAIEREIGRGGMATVFLARDLRHNRRVALKVLNSELGAVLGVERFLAEIETTANLQHPHLLPLFDSGEAAGLLFYVMPYVEGESLRHRLDREKQLPVDEAVRIATAVAQALDYAHQHGVIHRDLKPENILLQHGQPVVADFGIALAVSNAGGQRITQTGLSLGTPQYMSPEQATGDRVIDGRTDIYSLGAVLYEMLVGDPPHTGSTVQAIVAKVLTEKPPGVRLQRDTVPPQVEAALERALAKLPADRFATAREMADALEGKGMVLPRAVAATNGAVLDQGSARSWRARFSDPLVAGLAVVAVGLAVAVAALAFRPRQVAEPARAVVATLLPPPGEAFHSRRLFALSPDGSRIAFVAGAPVVSTSTVPPMTVQLGAGRLYVRSLDGTTATPLLGTEGAQVPFWSPDGRSIGFFAGGQLKVIDASGTGMRSLCSAPRGFAGAWGRDGTILFNPLPTDGVWRVSASGGPCERVTVPARGEVGHVSPSFLPDGRHFLFGATESPRLFIGDLTTASYRLLSDEREAGRFVPPNHVLYRHNDGGLYAQRLDLASLELVGEPWRVLERVSWLSFRLGVSASETGALVAEVPEPSPPSKLIVIEGTRVLDSIALESRMFRFSGDGRRLALGGGGLRLYDVARRISTPLPVWPDTVRQDALSVVWSPGDSLLAYSQNIEQYGANLLDLRTGAVIPLVAPPNGREVLVTDWMPDGRHLLLVVLLGRGAPKSEAWLWSIGDRAGRPIFTTPSGSGVTDARVSPDGRWIAYESDESGVLEIYVRPYPGPGAPVRVSVDRGTRPRWRYDGGAVYYLGADGAIMTAEMRGGAVESPRIAVPAPPLGQAVRSFEPLPNGRGFLMARGTMPPSQLTLILGWAALRGAR